jgi:hypothetical protein
MWVSLTRNKKCYIVLQTYPSKKLHEVEAKSEGSKSNVEEEISKCLQDIQTTRAELLVSYCSDKVTRFSTIKLLLSIFILFF